MSHIVGQDKPDITDLSHFGVKGMKWGQRKSADQIRSARKRFSRRVEDFHDSRKELKKTTVRGSKARQSGEKRLAKMKTSLLNDPDRATALRLTRGEKWLTGVGGFGAVVLTGGAAIPVAAAVGVGVAATGRTIASRVIESKQNKRRKG